jgi:hypothetical protein
MKYRGRTEIVATMPEAAKSGTTKTKSSECHKELTDTGKYVGCSLSPEVCTCHTTSEYDTTGTFVEANVTSTINKVEYDTTGANEEPNY